VVDRLLAGCWKARFSAGYAYGTIKLTTGFLGMSKKIAGNEKGIMVEVEFQRILILQRVLILCYGAK
jgi:hypothetical protein